MSENESMDILFAGTLPPHPGGTAIVCGQLLAALSERGHRVRAIAPVTTETIRQADGYARQHPAIEMHRIVVPRFVTSTQTPPSQEDRCTEQRLVEEKLRSLTLNNRPDVVILGRETFLPSSQHVVACGIPTAVIVHSGLTHAVLADEYPVDLSREYFNRLNQVDLAVTPLATLASELQSSTSTPVVVIDNPVDLQQFRPCDRDPALMAALGIRDDDDVLVHVSNLKHEKQPLDIIRSAKNSLEHNRRLRYLIVGDGTLRADMQQAAAISGIADRFTFTGWVSHEDVPKYMNLADVVLMTSSIETQAMVYLEAMACGRLLLTSDIPAARQVVKDGITGLLFRTGDLHDLTDKTLLAFRDEHQRTRISQLAREAVRAHEIRHVIDAYESNLLRLIRRPVA